MIRPFALYIGLRFLRAKRQRRFASLVSLASTAGVALGVAVLIVVLSVMNGFEREITKHIVGVTSHATVLSPGHTIANWREIAEEIRHIPAVRAVEPFIRGNAMLNRKGEIRGITLYGIPVEREHLVSTLPHYLAPASLASLAAPDGTTSAILGTTLAERLDLKAGEQATLIVSRWDNSNGVTAPTYRPLRVADTFKIGMQEFDGSFAIVSLERAAELFELGDTVSGLRVKFASPSVALANTNELQQFLGENFLVLDWSQFHRNFFRAIKSQKLILLVILSLIIAVASFNVISSLVMLIKEKQKEIAILRTQGCSAATIMCAFLLQGLIIGLIGTGVGTLLGVVLAQHANTLLEWSEALFGTKLVNPEVYYISYLPAAVSWADIAVVTGLALFICVAASLFPAYRAARIMPLAALRYE